MQDNIKIEANLIDVLGEVEGGALMSCNLEINGQSWDTIYWVQESGVGVLTFSDELLNKLGIQSEEDISWYADLISKLDSSISDKKSLIKAARELGNIEEIKSDNDIGNIEDTQNEA